MENIISEFRVIETDDGFRIEIKGDKEKLRPFFTGAAFHGAGPWRHGHGWRGPWGMFGRMGPWWGSWGFEPEEGDKGDEPREA
jgi:hypothetical protein